MHCLTFTHFFSIYRQLVQSVTRKERARHCRRQTRGVQVTISAIDDLLQRMRNRTNLLGVKLFEWDDMMAIWDTQRKHVRCIQDIAGVELYTQTGTVKKGGVVLPVYRCARGSTSVESFHKHLYNFIPGK